MRTGAAAWTGALKAKRRATCLKLAKKFHFPFACAWPTFFWKFPKKLTRKQRATEWSIHLRSEEGQHPVHRHSNKWVTVWARSIYSNLNFDFFKKNYFDEISVFVQLWRVSFESGAEKKIEIGWICRSIDVSAAHRTADGCHSVK